MNEQTTMILIDTALASGSASALDPEERKLQELVLAVRDDAPVPDPGFELRMNARVAAGFPPRKRTGIGALFTKRPQMMALGAAASVLIALIVAVSVMNSGGGGSRTMSTKALPSAGGGSASDSAGVNELQSTPGTAAAPAQKAAPSVGAGTVSPAPPSPGGFVGGRNRKVERSAALVLAPSKDKLNEVGDQVIAVTDRYRGIVQRSSVTSAADQGSYGSFDLRIPVRNLQPALRDMSALADVKSRTENADDVTASFVSARTRLEELTAERRGLLRRLESAPTDQAAAAIRARIRLVNAQIESQQRALTELRRRTSYASVSVTLEPKNGSGGGGIGDGARDLRDNLIDAANLSLRVLGVVLPISLVLALLWWIGSRFNRRRREAVLD